MKRPTLTTYLKLCTEYYDLDKHSDKDTIDSLAFYMDYGIRAQGPILEPMCGTGRFLIPMARAGLDIEGFDASEYMLDALRQKYVTLSKNNPPVWQQFVQDFSSDRRYNLIFVPFGSWGLITDLEDSKKSLEIMHKHLAPGGKLILEIETIASVPKCGVWNRGVHTRPDGSYLAINTFSSYEQITQLFTSICRYESILKNKIDAIETEDFKMYLYRFNEMDQLLIEAGFSKIIKYQDHTKAIISNEQAPLIIYECSK